MKNFKNKKIIVTGHTGFKGSWLTLWLLKYGANVVGISKSIPTNPSHYTTLNLKKKIKEYFIDIGDKKKQLEKIFIFEKPDFIFHLAAQPIVSESYKNPFQTWNTNTVGTLNILEALKKVKKKTYVIMITSDKVYKNFEFKRGYVENDALGGEDPYSASKGSADLMINSYIKSYFFGKKNKVFISIARAGNVIGGGDWSDNRLIPDFVKSIKVNKMLIIRNPYSTRPWQHVLEVIYGYMLLAIKLSKQNSIHGEAFNFGPNFRKKITVINIIKLMQLYWKKINFKLFKNKNLFYETKLLYLNSNKARKYLNWRCVLTIEQSIKLASEWYKLFYTSKSNLKELTLNQINDYEKLIENKKKYL